MRHGGRIVAGLLSLGFATALLASPLVTKREAARAYAAAAAYPMSHKSCLADLGPSRSAALARYCRFVSGATHPPCNVRNSCAMMVEHIRLMCPTDDAGLPCAHYFSRR